MVSIWDFRNLHEGKRVFLMASGPSLSHLDLTPLSRRIVIGMNRTSLLFPNTHYHCTMDLRLFDDYPDLLRSSRYLFTFEGRPFGIPLRLLGSEGFSWDLEKGIYSGYTVASRRGSRFRMDRSLLRHELFDLLQSFSHLPGKSPFGRLFQIGSHFNCRIQVSLSLQEDFG